MPHLRPGFRAPLAHACGLEDYIQECGHHHVAVVALSGGRSRLQMIGFRAAASNQVSVTGQRYVRLRLIARKFWHVLDRWGGSIQTDPAVEVGPGRLVVLSLFLRHWSFRSVAVIGRGKPESIRSIGVFGQSARFD